VPKAFRDVQREPQAALWAPVWAEQLSTELRKARPDVVLIDFVLLGAIAAAEAAGIPAVVLMHNVLSRSLLGVPPYGPGWLPARGPLGRENRPRLAVAADPISLLSLAGRSSW